MEFLWDWSWQDECSGQGLKIQVLKAYLFLRSIIFILSQSRMFD